ncbi:MAG: orotate phosphoribosyltransferase-like protein [Thermoplasmata archaeon]
MKSIDALVRRAMEFKEKGLSEKEIGDELHLSPETVTWLLTRGVKGEAPPRDIKIGWRSVGVYGNRIGFISAALTDVILEETEKRDLKATAVLGIAINGIPYATLISEDMGMELVVYRPAHDRPKGGAFSSNYAGVDGKDVIIIDDVISTGETIRGAIKETQEAGGQVVLAVVFVNKTDRDDVDGVPLRALVRARGIM